MKMLSPRPRTPHRSATVLICVLACMAVVTAIVANTTRMALVTRKALRPQVQLRQVELLLEAGVARAAKRLAIDPDYTGESWQLSPGTLTCAEQAEVNISVTTEGETWPPQATIVATLGTADTVHMKRTHTFAIDVSLSPLGD